MPESPLSRSQKCAKPTTLHMSAGRVQIGGLHPNLSYSERRPVPRSGKKIVLSLTCSSLVFSFNAVVHNSAPSVHPQPAYNHY